MECSVGVPADHSLAERNTYVRATENNDINITTALCRLVVRGNRQKVLCVVYTTTSFPFSIGGSC